MEPRESAPRPQAGPGRVLSRASGAAPARRPRIRPSQQAWKNAVLVLASGYILTFYSEFAFYGQLHDPGTPTPSVFELLLLWGIYSLMASIVLTLVRRYRVASLPALLIVGAMYGWLLEGGITTTTYEDLPWSLSFTGLAWHMPVDLVFGWYFVQKWLRQRNVAFNLRAAALAGLLWGFWAVWPAEVIALRPAWFAMFAFGTVGLLLGAYWVIGRVGWSAFRPSRSGMVWTGVLFGGWYLVHTAWAVPLSLVLLPLLLGVCGWALRRNATFAVGPDLLETLAGRPRAGNLLAWLAFPLVAAAEYALWATTGWTIPSHVLGYLVATPLGFGLFFWALGYIIQPRRRPL